ncbi:MAG: site-2 protease family protein [Candidatus Shapirobacteria bacterium]
MANIISFLALIIAITVHEFSHAFVADRLGDPTPRSNGRLSLNPMAHADMVGTILLPLIGLFTGLPTIGWAKPVPIDPYNLSNPKRDRLLIALAGPLSNFIVAIIFALISKFLSINLIVIYIIILVNISIAIFNLIPIPPLDGSQILLSILPQETADKWEEAFSKYGLILLLAFLFLPIGGSTLVSIIMGPVVKAILNFIV